MTNTSTALQRTERYVYWSIHWGFPLLPLIALAVMPGPAPWAAKLAFFVAITVAAGSALAVVHTWLRREGLLDPSPWDRIALVRNPAPFRWVWGLATLASAALMPSVVPHDFLLTVSFSILISAILAQPLLEGNPLRAALACLGSAVLAVCTLLAPGALPIELRIQSSFMVVVVTPLLLTYAIMFLNTLETARVLDRARGDQARLAVTEERLRFSRDLHDVFGRTLSAVALKAELAAAQAERGRPEAADTMREVQSIAIAAQEEVRAVVRGYREADLSAEVAGARAVLEAAGISVTTVIEGADTLPSPVARTFAWVVREAATNVLRHADATHVRISLTADAAGARLVVANDRPRAAGTPGSGLTGLRERLAEVGGTLDASRDADHFTLTAAVGAEALAHLARATATPHEESA